MERKEQGQKIIKALFSNWEIKLISVLIGFGLWFAVMYFENPPGQETFTNIPVQFINTDDLTDRGYVYEVLDGTDVVDEVTVKGTRKALSEMKSMGNESILAVADFANRDASGAVEIRLTPVTQDKEAITEIRSDADSTHLRLNIEQKAEKSLTVKVIIEGEVAEQHQLGAAKVEQNRIKITGGKSKIDQVYSAAVVVDITGSDSDITTTDTIKLYDINGQQLDNNLVQKNINSTKITVTILGTKTVPVEYDVTGEVMEGYRMTGEITSSKESITLAGSDSVLASVNSIVIPSEVLNVNGRSENLLEAVNLKNYLPAGVQIAKSESDTTTTIEVVIEKILERNYKMLSDNVVVKNVPAAYTYETAEAHEVYDVKVAGLNGDLNQIRESTLGCVVDVAAWMKENNIEKLQERTYYIPAEFELPNGVELIAPVEIEVTFEKISKR